MKKLLVKLLTKLVLFLNSNKELTAGSLSNPKIEIGDIQETANKAASKAYLDEIKSYYTSYDSPYKKLISTELKKQKFSYPLSLPDIMARINENLLNEIDKIANQAVAMSFVPMITDMFLECKKHIKLSEILKEIIEEIEPESEHFEFFEFSYEKPERADNWLNCKLTTHDNYYEFTLHEKTEYKNGDFIGLGKYEFLRFPSQSYKSEKNRNMTILKDDIKIEMPFVPGILQDKVLKLFFKYMLSSCEIEMDCNGFDADMFPNGDED